jgi:hypothetical protein
MDNNNYSLHFIKNSNRLIVLIPEYCDDDNNIMQNISKLGKIEKRKILLVAVADSENQMKLLSQRIAKYKSFLSTINIEVSSTFTASDSWVKSLKEIYHPGDTIICQAEQSVIDNRFKSVPISEFLTNHIQATVHSVAGNQCTHKAVSKKDLYEIFWLLGFLLIITLFTWMEIKLDIVFHGSQQTILEMISVVIECLLLWLWYIFGKNR